MSYPHGAAIERGPMAADNFTQVSNRLFRDHRITWKAKGLFGYMASHTEGWQVTMKAMISAGKDGRDAVYAGLSELIKYGYLERTQERREDGTLGEWKYRITDVPAHLLDLLGEEGAEAAIQAWRAKNRRSAPLTDSPDPAQPDPENPHPKKTKAKKTNTTEEKTAPSARSAHDARRATTGSSARDESSGSAASGAARASRKSPIPKKTVPGARISRKQGAAIRLVENAFPAPLRELMPRNRPRVVTEAILGALGAGTAERTPEQIGARVDRRWYTWGFDAKAEAIDPATGKPILGSAVGALVKILGSGKCPEPRCEDGLDVDTDERCEACTERKADRRHAAKSRPCKVIPAPRRGEAPQQWWECRECGVPGKGASPQSGLCWDCRTEAAASAEAAARWEAAEEERQAAKRAALVEQAYGEQSEREEQLRNCEAEETAAAERAQAETEETTRLRTLIAAQHPELLAYATQTQV